MAAHRTSIYRTPASAMRAVATSADRRVLVPTMGALHAGHAALVGKARTLAGPTGAVWVSIYVNPTQFGPREDFKKYPRPFLQDAAMCRELGVDAIFAPHTLYETDHSVWIDETLLSCGLCGGTRPGHFRGVCTVVAKLFHIVQPHMAVFGEKDYQQLAVIRRMVRGLHMPVRIHALPTVRESDGLALSSRNRYLTPEERSQAPQLHRVLLAARRSLRDGASVRHARTAALRLLKKNAPLSKLDYLEIVDADTLQPSPGGRRRILAAVYFGTTRLIDNIAV